MRILLAALLRDVAAATGTRSGDSTPALSDSRQTLDARYRYDGLRLNGLGYQRWIQHLRSLALLPEAGQG